MEAIEAFHWIVLSIVFDLFFHSIIEFPPFGLLLKEVHCWPVDIQGIQNITTYRISIFIHVTI